MQELPPIPHPVEFTRTRLSRRQSSEELAKAASIIHEQRAQLDSMQLLLDQERELRRIAEQESLTDKVTGLPNRRAFEDDIEKLIKVSKESGGSIAIMLGDLNGLKKANDTYGYEEGDKLIKAMRGTTRPEEDTLYRYGGDEFLFVLPNFEPMEGQTEDQLIHKTLSRVETTYEESLQTANLGEGIEGSITVVLDFVKPGDTVASVMDRLSASLHDKKREFYAARGITVDDPRVADFNS